MATVTVRGVPGQSRRSSSPPVRRTKHVSHSARIGLWFGRHLWRGTRWTAVTVGRHTGRATSRGTRHAHGQAKQWLADAGEFGFFRHKATCSCGYRGAADRLHEHWARDHEHEQPDRSGGFSGDETRANEPASRWAWAQRMDKPAPLEVTDTPMEVEQVNDPMEWARSAEVLAEPSLASTDETIAWFAQAAAGAHAFREHIDALVDYFETIQMDGKIRQHMEEIRDQAHGIGEQFIAAQRRADELWGDITVPQFERAA